MADLREKNYQVLDVLTKSYERKQPPVKSGKIAIILPAYYESSIAEILEELMIQIPQLDRVTEIEIIIGLNKEHLGGLTHNAVVEFLEKYLEVPIYKEVSYKIVSTKEQGKLVAFDRVLDYLEAQPVYPEHLFFFDVDSKLTRHCLKDMYDLFNKGNKAVGASIVPRDNPETVLEALANLPTKGHGSGEGAYWLQGGAFAISSDIAPLYHAYTHAFPGTTANDVNWTMIMQEKGLPYELTQKPGLSMDPPQTFADLVMQQDRWLKGSRQCATFIDSTRPVLRTSILGRTIRHIKEYFPNFPQISRMDIDRFFEIGIKKEFWGLPFYQALYFAIDRLKKPISVRIEGKIIKIGGKPPNPYIPRGWIPPQRAVNSSKAKSVPQIIIKCILFLILPIDILRSCLLF